MMSTLLPRCIRPPFNENTVTRTAAPVTQGIYRDSFTTFLTVPREEIGFGLRPTGYEESFLE